MLLGFPAALIPFGHRIVRIIVVKVAASADPFKLVCSSNGCISDSLR